MRALSAILFCALSFLGACRDDDPFLDPTETASATATDTADTETTTMDSSACVGTDTAVEHGFHVRTPQLHEGIACDGEIPREPMDVLEVDWLCTFAHEGVEGVVYARATPTGCTALGLSALPTFAVECAVLGLDGQRVALENPVYDIGGNHHNDTLSFGYQGRTYEYYHSSFGFGWRKCQPMDCLVVRDVSGALIENGCTDERTLPVHCSQVQQDGSYDPIEADDFAECQGDSD